MTCFAAADHGHLDVLKWLRENGCPWDEETCAYAARGGHLEVLKWARENGCPWDEDTCARRRVRPARGAVGARGGGGRGGGCRVAREDVRECASSTMGYVET